MVCNRWCVVGDVPSLVCSRWCAIGVCSRWCVVGGVPSVVCSRWEKRERAKEAGGRRKERDGI